MFPANHSWWQVAADASTLERLPIHFGLHTDFAIPRDGYLAITGEQLRHGGLQFTHNTTTRFALLGLAPGTYFLHFTLRTWANDAAVPGGAVLLHVEIVVPQQLQQQHRAWHYELQGAERRPIALVNLRRSVSSVNRSEQLRMSRPTAVPVVPPATTDTRTVIPVCFVGTMAGPIDGQKKMWLQLMAALGPNALHDVSANNSSSTGTGHNQQRQHPLFDMQMKTFQEPPGETPMVRALRAVNVSLRSVALSASPDERAAYGLTPANAHAFLLAQLYNVLPHARAATAAVSLQDVPYLNSIAAPVAAAYWRNITRELTTCEGGVLLFANARSDGDKCLVLAARLAGVRAVVMELANLHPTPLDVDVVLAPSHYAATHASVVSAVHATRTYVLSTGIDTAVFKPKPLLSVAKLLRPYFVVGTVGRVATDKSMGLVLAMARAVAPTCAHCRFQIVGDGALAPHLKRLALDWGLGDVVDFVAAIYNDDAHLVQTLQAMDAYFVPSFSETLGIAGLEAMAVGLPVIGFRNAGGTSEYLVDGFNGVVLDDTSPDAMRTAVEMLESDPALRMRLGANARATVLDRFSLDRRVPQFAALYERLARSPSRRA